MDFVAVIGKRGSELIEGVEQIAGGGHVERTTTPGADIQSCKNLSWMDSLDSVKNGLQKRRPE